jgi:hypothetical protein
VGRAAEATALLERPLADRERILGPSHPDTLTSRHNLAAVHSENGRTAEAIPLFERTLTDREQVLGPGHPHTVQTRGSLRRSRCSNAPSPTRNEFALWVAYSGYFGMSTLSM